MPHITCGSMSTCPTEKESLGGKRFTCLVSLRDQQGPVESSNYPVFLKCFFGGVSGLLKSKNNSTMVVQVPGFIGFLSCLACDPRCGSSACLCVDKEWCFKRTGLRPARMREVD